MAQKPTPASRDSSPRPRSVPRAQEGVKQPRNGSAKSVADARRDLEERGTRNFPELAGRKLYGELTMIVTVNHDGRILDTIIAFASHHVAHLSPMIVAPLAPCWISPTRRRISARMMRSPSSASAISSARSWSGGITSASTAPSA